MHICAQASIHALHYSTTFDRDRTSHTALRKRAHCLLHDSSRSHSLKALANSDIDCVLPTAPEEFSVGRSVPAVTNLIFLVLNVPYRFG